MIMMMEEDWTTQFQRQTVRISASNVAALTGFHPYKDLPELWLHLIYAGRLGAALLRHDAALLDLTFTTPDQVLMELARKVGSTTTLSAVQEALQVQKGEKVVGNVTAAAEIQQRGLQDAAQVLTATELQRLSEGLRDAVNTGYGTAQEDDALDLYQAQIQWPVTQRNGELRVWPYGKRYCDAKKKEEVYALCSAYVEKSFLGDTTLPPPPPILEDAFFCIVGSVDGIREELVLEEGTQDDDEEERWSIRQSIVECKHRMQRIYATPPLYEQIQTALYCRMYQVDAAEIVQILRRPENNDDKQQQPSVILDVHRLHLDDPVLQHRQHWHTCLLPRLASVTAAIYKIRADDHARYCFLTALASNTIISSDDDHEKNAAAAWKILFSHCDWLRDGDTAWARSRRNG